MVQAGPEYNGLGLKVSSGPNPVVLVPQPSNDKNDPLNWSLRRRDGYLAILCVLSVIASTLSSLLAANTLTLTIYFRRSFTDTALLTGYHLLGVGIAGFMFVASARVWGKRHLYILGTVIIIVSCIWAGVSGHNYKSLLWARIFQGVGLAPFEALVNASVADLFFVHERGKRMALSNLALFGGAFFTPVIVGKMTSTLGWQWPFFFVAIFAGALLPVVIFCCPETTYVRPDYLNNPDLSRGTDVARSSHSEDSHEMALYGNTSNIQGNTSSEKYPTSADSVRVLHPQPSSHPQGHTAPSFLQILRPFNGRKSNEPFYKLLLRPFALFLQPAILWACLIQGTLIGWTVLIGIILGAIMILPPLSFNEVQTGYMYSAAFIGALLGFALAGVLADSSAKYLARRNRGIYEPEFRLVLVVPQLIFGCAGLYGFGIVANDVRRYGWFWPCFFFALEVVGMVLGAVASSLYLADAYSEITVEAFTCLLVFKNVFSFGLTFSGLDWLSHTGIKPVFDAVASVQVGICCLTFFMCKYLSSFCYVSFRTLLTLYCIDVFGKRNRSFFARHDLFELFRLR